MTSFLEKSTGFLYTLSYMASHFFLSIVLSLLSGGALGLLGRSRDDDASFLGAVFFSCLLSLGICVAYYLPPLKSVLILSLFLVFFIVLSAAVVFRSRCIEAGGYLLLQFFFIALVATFLGINAWPMAMVFLLAGCGVLWVLKPVLLGVVKRLAYTLRIEVAEVMVIDAIHDRVRSLGLEVTSQRLHRGDYPQFTLMYLALPLTHHLFLKSLFDLEGVHLVDVV